MVCEQMIKEKQHTDLKITLTTLFCKTNSHIYHDSYDYLIKMMQQWIIWTGFVTCYKMSI